MLGAYYRGWANSYLWSLRESDDRPNFSRCSIGKKRWQWVVFKGLLCDEEPPASGIADSADAAKKEAEEAVGAVRATGGWAARGYRRKQLAVERSRKISAGQSTSPIEYAYRCHRYCSDYDGKAHDVIEKHRIVKRTKKRIFVDKDEFRPGAQLNGDWRDYVRSNFVLDRHDFETHGVANRRSRGWWDHERYYSDPAIYFAERALAARPECFVVLDVPADATEAEIAAAYRRLASKTHPDVGGNAEEFKRIHRAFEQAMAIIANGDGEKTG
jgi:hypothetical protein